MSTTDFIRSSTHTNLVEQKWNAKLFKFVHKNSYFGKYVGKEGSGSLVETKTDLLKESGDRITFSIDRPITDTGVIDDGTREGQEVAMNYDDFSVDIHEWSQQVRLKGKKTEQSTSIPLRNRAKRALGNWMKFMIDANTTLCLSGLASNNSTFDANAHSTNRQWHGGQKADGTLDKVTDGDANITSSTNHLFGPEVIEAVKRKATLPADGYSKLSPIIVDGEEIFVMFIHKYQAKALKATTSWKEGHQYGDVRGRKNAIFSGALGMWDGVLIHEYDHIETRLGAGGTTDEEVFEAGDGCSSGIYVARALFCGAQAAVHAYAQYPGMTVKKFDYGSKFGCSIDALIGIGKPDFNSEDFGVVTVDTAYVPD